MPSIVVAEVYSKLLREVDRGNETEEGARSKIDFLLWRSYVVELDADIALRAAEIDRRMKRAKKGWGLADSIVYATALVVGAVVITGDKHFRGLPHVIMIK